MPNDPTIPRPVCPRCTLTIEPGEHHHPTVKPFHVPCRLHNQCYVLCVDSHPEIAEEFARIGRGRPVQREVPGGA